MSIFKFNNISKMEALGYELLSWNLDSDDINLKFLNDDHYIYIEDHRDGEYNDFIIYSYYIDEENNYLHYGLEAKELKILYDLIEEVKDYEKK